mmetsp:Transcript_8824/g.31254  ORF Transcript_8824/g.31254 Transcript_8824/m.31254 type:complete len:102 (+) Transcript_8824:357-662(+)
MLRGTTSWKRNNPKHSYWPHWSQKKGPKSCSVDKGETSETDAKHQSYIHRLKTGWRKNKVTAGTKTRDLNAAPTCTGKHKTCRTYSTSKVEIATESQSNRQ